MAAQMAAEGLEVGLLALIDTLHPQYSKNLSSADRRSFYFAEFSSRIGKYGRNVLNLRASALLQDGQRFVRTHARKAFRAISAKKNSKLTETTLIDAHLLREVRRQFVPKVYDGRIILLNASDQPKEYRADQTLGWKNSAKGKIAIHTVPGSHVTILHAPFVLRLAAQLTPYLTSTATNSCASSSKKSLRGKAGANPGSASL